MNLHEFQTKQVLRKYGIPVLDGHVAETPGQASDAFRKLGGPVAVVKARIHAGGRGKGGGVKLVRGADEAGQVAERLLGKPLVTHQTGPQGRIVRKVYVEAGCEIAKEFYLGGGLDRRPRRPGPLATPGGGGGGGGGAAS